jgi:hypothetical protein
MKKIVIASLACIAVIVLFSCEYKKEVAPAITPACDTSNVRYSVEIVNILSANCYSCHASSIANSSGGGNKLDNYTTLKPYASSGLLYNVVNHTPGYDFMPKNLPQISSCDIAKIRTWIRNGYLNN